jgi:hypothetical protein
VTLLNFDVRFTPESGHSLQQSECPLWANSGHRRLANSGSANRLYHPMLFERITSPAHQNQIGRVVGTEALGGNFSRWTASHVSEFLIQLISGEWNDVVHFPPLILAAIGVDMKLTGFTMLFPQVPKRLISKSFEFLSLDGRFAEVETV